MKTAQQFDEAFDNGEVRSAWARKSEKDRNNAY